MHAGTGCVSPAPAAMPFVKHTTFTAVVVLLAGLATPIGPQPAAGGRAAYDVSYLWHRDLDSVIAYHRQLSRVLGPTVAAKLKVVDRSNLYGIVYHRRGDSAGAARVARAHTRVLRARGLAAAAPVRSRDWVFVDSDATPGASPVAIRRSAQPPTMPDLEAAVERSIKQLRREGKIAADERTGWAVHDFKTGKKLVTINEDVPFQAASLAKPFFAAAFFVKVESGRLIYGSKSRRHMERMIQRSNNHSTNWVLRRVGGPREAERLLKRKYPTVFRDTTLVEYIPAGGRTYRNRASIGDYSRFLHALWRDDIAGSREIKRLMALPGPDRLFTGARALPHGTKVYNKTGSTARLCGDMGILIVRGADGQHYPYSLVGVIEKQRRTRSYSSWIRSRGDVIRSVSNIVYRGISQHHGLQSRL